MNGPSRRIQPTPTPINSPITPRDVARSRSPRRVWSRRTEAIACDSPRKATTPARTPHVASRCRATKLQTTTDTVPLLKSGELGSPSFGVRLLSKSMNQLCMEESFAINVSVTFVPANTTIGGPGSEIVALDFPHPRAAFAYRVRFKGCGSGRMEIVPVIELGWYRHRYVQLPGRSATNDHTTTFIAAVLKSGELGSSPFGPRLLS